MTELPSNGMTLNTLNSMGLLSDSEITYEFAFTQGTGLIEPFYPYMVRKGLSYGLGSYGYDIRLSPNEMFLIPKIAGRLIDPKKSYKHSLEDIPLNTDPDSKENYYILPAHSSALGVALEYLQMPVDVTGICWGKSTYARSGVFVNMTPIEAGWHGHLTININNTSSCDVKVYANEGIAQILFIRGFPCSSAYGDRKYQNQPHSVTVSKS